MQVVQQLLMWSQFQGIVKNQDHPYVADYSYIKVKNRFEDDSYETLAHMAVWQLDDPDRKGLIPTFLKSTGLKGAIFMIVLDLAKPWEIDESLQTWLKVAEETSKQLMKDMDEDESKKLRNEVSRYVQTFIDVSLKEDSAGGKGELGAITPGDSKFDANNPEINIGVPVVIVGSKGDIFSSFLHKNQSASDRFEFATRRLRQTALKYGASLMFTSVAGEGENLQLLQDYIFHRKYGFELRQSAKAAATVDRFGLYIPSGFDSNELIQSVRPAKSAYDDAQAFVKVFPNPNKESKRRAEEEKVKALKNNQFYKLLQQKLKSGAGRSASSSSSKAPSSVDSASLKGIRGSPKPRSPRMSSTSSSSRSGRGSRKGSSSSPKSQIAVRQFFQSLLTGTGTKKVTSSSAASGNDAGRTEASKNSSSSSSSNKKGSRKDMLTIPGSSK
eukprot:jgi/Bigna1/92012/estExt_fgenesh1_pg.C_1680001